MKITNDQFIKLLAEEIGQPETITQIHVRGLISEIQQAVTAGDQYEIKGFGTFVEKNDQLTFIPADNLAAEININYAGMLPVDVDASKLPDENNDDTLETPPPSDKPKITKSNILIVDDDVSDEEVVSDKSFNTFNDFETDKTDSETAPWEDELQQENTKKQEASKSADEEPAQAEPDAPDLDDTEQELISEEDDIFGISGAPAKSILEDIDMNEPDPVDKSFNTFNDFETDKTDSEVAPWEDELQQENTKKQETPQSAEPESGTSDSNDTEQELISEEDDILSQESDVAHPKAPAVKSADTEKTDSTAKEESEKESAPKKEIKTKDGKKVKGSVSDSKTSQKDELKAAIAAKVAEKLAAKSAAALAIEKDSNKPEKAAPKAKDARKESQTKPDSKEKEVAKTEEEKAPAENKVDPKFDSSYAPKPVAATETVEEAKPDETSEVAETVDKVKEKDKKTATSKESDKSDKSDESAVSEDVSAADSSEKAKKADEPTPTASAADIKAGVKIPIQGIKDGKRTDEKPVIRDRHELRKPESSLPIVLAAVAAILLVVLGWWYFFGGDPVDPTSGELPVAGVSQVMTDQRPAEPPQQQATTPAETPITTTETPPVEPEPEPVEADVTQAEIPSEPARTETAATQETAERPQPPAEESTPAPTTTTREAVTSSARAPHDPFPGGQAWEDTRSVTPILTGMFGLEGDARVIQGRVYSIVVHSLPTLALANRARDEIRELGLRCLVVEARGPRGERTFRVGIGQFPTMEEAEIALPFLPEPYRSRNFIARIN